MGIEREVFPAAPVRRLSLRNAAINYRAGWWSVTVQVAKNKSILGAVVGDRVVLNALGQAVAASWRALPTRYPELEIFDFVVMPNHFHALLRIHWRETNRTQHLGFLMGRFKGGTSFLYGRLRRAGEIEDIGASLWQRDYWDDLVTSAAEFRGWQRYIRENPAHWSSDRYGACTAHVQGDAELLSRSRVAFVASQGFGAAALRPRKIWARGGGATEVAPSDREGGGEGRADKAGNGERRADKAGGGERVLISTFTSAQEREALRRALAKRRPLIAVFPAGIPEAGALGEDLTLAIREGRALAVSPQAPGSRLNKKIATWCNEFVLKNADEIWVGDLSPNGMLAQMLAGLGRGGAGRPLPRPNQPPLSKGATSVAPPPRARGQALMELAVGLFALALVVSALCGFAHYIAKSLRVQNELRVGGKRSDAVEISSWAAQHVFGAETLKISERLAWPSTVIVK